MKPYSLPSRTMLILAGMLIILGGVMAFITLANPGLKRTIIPPVEAEERGLTESQIADLARYGMLAGLTPEETVGYYIEVQLRIYDYEQAWGDLTSLD